MELVGWGPGAQTSVQQQRPITWGGAGTVPCWGLDQVRKLLDQDSAEVVAALISLGSYFRCFHKRTLRGLQSASGAANRSAVSFLLHPRRLHQHGGQTLSVRFHLSARSASASPWDWTMGNHGSSLDEILAEDMHHWYNKFMRESPSGLITLFELKAILNLRGMNETANSYVDQVFFTFDMDGVRTRAQSGILGPHWTLIHAERPTCR